DARQDDVETCGGRIRGGEQRDECTQAGARSHESIPFPNLRGNAARSDVRAELRRRTRRPRGAPSRLWRRPTIADRPRATAVPTMTSAESIVNPANAWARRAAPLQCVNPEILR